MLPLSTGIMIKTILFLAVTLVQGLFSPGVFWLQPDKFYYTWGETCTINLVSGYSFPGENWAGQKEQLQDLTIFFSGVKDNFTNAFANSMHDSIQLMLLDEGTAMVTCNVTSSWINPEISGQDYNPPAVAPADSLAVIKNQPLQESHGENWQDNIKTIFQVGTNLTKTCLQKTGLIIDIIPVSNPYQINQTDTLAFTIYYRENPLTNTAVELWHQDAGSTIPFSLTTDENGQIRFPVIKSGTWMISCTKKQLPADSTNSTPLNYRGSCTWGYE